MVGVGEGDWRVGGFDGGGGGGFVGWGRSMRQSWW